ncbi:winged helix-turn-helix domain-containing protein [Alkalimonas collagenimarina]|uniref:Winged helix-turn-helix domain-containing protein n=1 Tax=Alkalimonas collagenimarina TaxID=400390 RepID=A0ABT9GZ41_9GAMM|nr:winged helix-turn-helix domain-containing protein [Alkalimonas collagenimarina]MDP4536326.1 winged helix-turn-helix domain-containing protein [Alkalimonas collagenimarina]
MRWQIDDFVFCDQHQSLTHDGKVQQLEPILVELLSYFCHNPDTIISRDELVAAVWLGRTVTDGAVNRAITKLRRCFADNPKAPRFIATFPKKGYKFIAVVRECVPDEHTGGLPGKHSHQAGKANRTVDNRYALYTAIALIVVAIGLFLVKPDKDTASLITQAKRLTHSAGQEWQPRISPDQQYLTYTEIVANKMQLFIKQLSDGSTVEVTPVDDPNAWVGPASWNSTGDKLVYLVATQDYCRYYLQSFAAMTLGEPQLIHNCPAGSYGKIAFSHSDNVLIYTERSGTNSSYVLFEFDLITGQKRKLNQPPLVLAGNISFDLHPTQNKLLVSSVDEQMWERFYSVDLDTDELTLLFKLDSYICCGIWDHSGKRVVLMGEHPAVQLVSYDLQGKDRQVVYAGSQQLHPPERHTNGIDYVFPAGRSNLDTHFYSFTTLKTKHIVNSSVDDRLARVSPQEDKVAYVGLASGTEEIWLADSNGSNQRQLTRFNDQRHYLDLTWAPNGKTLAGLTLNEIHLIDINNHNSRVLRIPQMDIRAISFKDDQTVFYSVKQDGQWVVKRYNITTDEVSGTDSKWQFVRFDADDKNTLWVDQQNKIYVGAAAQPVEIPQHDTFKIMVGRHFNVRKQGANWYWQHWDNDQYQLYSMGPEQNQPSPVLRSDSPHIDLSATGIFYHKAERRNTDIFQTVALK